MRGFGLLAFVVVTGCATTETVAVSKMPFDEAMGWSESHARLQKAPVDDPKASAALASTMRSFSQTSHQVRASVAHGAPMPPHQIERWHALLDEIAVYAAVPAKDSSVLDTVRTRLQLETEFENDGAVYGDVPVALTERVQLTLRSLATKLLAQTARLHAPASANEQLSANGWRWPVTPVLVTSPYGNRLHPIHNEYRFHAGVDLAAEHSQSVFAAEAGTVVFSGWNGGHGKQVELQHDGRVTTRYSHLDALLVRQGEVVKRGDLIGLVGETGVATGPHLHFEIRRDGDALDPEFVMTTPPSLPMARRTP